MHHERDMRTEGFYGKGTQSGTKKEKSQTLDEYCCNIGGGSPICGTFDIFDIIAKVTVKRVHNKGE
jgi:hypothetical protein